jgi:hypothetical protein
MGLTGLLERIFIQVIASGTDSGGLPFARFFAKMWQCVFLARTFLEKVSLPIFFWHHHFEGLILSLQ